VGFSFSGVFLREWKDGLELVKGTNRKESGLIIRISGLSNGLHEYHFTADPAEIGLNPGFNKEVTVGIHLDKSARQLYLKTDIGTSGMFECDRCLEQFELPIKAAYSVVYLTSEADRGKYPPEEIKLITPETSSIDLTPDVKEMLMLSVPLKLLCRDDCRGLCPRCGVNWNRTQCDCTVEADTSRWGDLKNLLNR